jgi:hypothetical protein
MVIGRFSLSLFFLSIFTYYTYYYNAGTGARARRKRVSLQFDCITNCFQFQTSFGYTDSSCCGQCVRIVLFFFIFQFSQTFERKELSSAKTAFVRRAFPRVRKPRATGLPSVRV